MSFSEEMGKAGYSFRMVGTQSTAAIPPQKKQFILRFTDSTYCFYREMGQQT